MFLLIHLKLFVLAFINALLFLVITAGLYGQADHIGNIVQDRCRVIRCSIMNGTNMDGNAFTVNLIYGGFAGRYQRFRY